MGILQNIFRSLGSNGEDDESSDELYPILDHYRKPCNGGSFRGSLCNIFKNLLRRISNILLFAKPRKPKPILPVVNPQVSTRKESFSSPSSDSSSDTSPGATYVPPSDLEWQRNYSDREVESHVNADTYTPPSDLEWPKNYSDREVESYVNADTYVPPSDLEWQRNYSDREVESHVNADTYTPPSDLEWPKNYSDREVESHVNADTYTPPLDLEWPKNYSDGEVESHVNADTYTPPLDLELQRDYSNTENEVNANAAWLQKPQLVSSAIRTESVEDEDSKYIKQLDVIIDVPTFNFSLAHKNAFDVVDSAVFIENCPSESGDRVEEEKVIKSLVAGGKWITHYNSNHRILLVGEGDFSFSASLAVAFGYAPNTIATSLDSEEFLKKNYKRAMSNIGKLRSRECIVMHGIDATKVASHHLLGRMTFDRIIYNFPFAGFFKELSREAQLRKHRRLVSLFLKNAKEMIGENGEIHISHKINGFHIEWKLESLASSHGLRLIEAVEFNKSDYKGYNTKRGFGGNNDFDCYPSKTYKFGLKRKKVQLLN